MVLAKNSTSVSLHYQPLSILCAFNQHQNHLAKSQWLVNFLGLHLREVVFVAQPVGFCIIALRLNICGTRILGYNVSKC